MLEINLILKSHLGSHFNNKSDSLTIERKPEFFIDLLSDIIL